MYLNNQLQNNLSIANPSLAKNKPRNSNIARANDKCIVFDNDCKMLPINYLYTINKLKLIKGALLWQKGKERGTLQLE